MPIKPRWYKLEAAAQILDTTREAILDAALRGEVVLS